MALSPGRQKDAENNHRHKWFQDRPARAQKRLFITDLQVTPGQEINQLPVQPQIAEI